MISRKVEGSSDTNVWEVKVKVQGQNRRTENLPLAIAQLSLKLFTKVGNPTEMISRWNIMIFYKMAAWCKFALSRIQTTNSSRFCRLRLLRDEPVWFENNLKKQTALLQIFCAYYPFFLSALQVCVRFFNLLISIVVINAKKKIKKR